MSLLAELEELQRCLEGTADSDSEEAAEPHITSVSKKRDSSVVGIVSKSDSPSVETVSKSDSSPEDTLSKIGLFPVETVSKNDSYVDILSKSDSSSVETVSKSDSCVEIVSKSDLSPVETMAKTDSSSVKTVSSDLDCDTNKQGSIQQADESNVQDLGSTSESGGAAEVRKLSETSTNKGTKIDRDSKDSETSLQKSFPCTSIGKKTKISPTKHTEVKTSALDQEKQVNSGNVLPPELEALLKNDWEDSTSKEEDFEAASTAKSAEIKLPTKAQEEEKEKARLDKERESAEEQRKSELMSPPLSGKKSPKPESVINRSPPRADKKSQLGPRNEDTSFPATLQPSLVPVGNVEAELKTFSIPVKTLSTPESKADVGAVKTVSTPVSKVGEEALKILSSPISNVGVGTQKLPMLCLEDQLKKNANPKPNIEKIEEMKILNGKPVIRVKKISTEYINKSVANVRVQESASPHDSVLNKRKCIPVEDQSQTAKKRKVSFDIEHKSTTLVHGDPDSETHHLKADHLKSNIRKQKLYSESVSEILSTTTTHKDFKDKFITIPYVMTGTKKLVVSLDSNTVNEMKKKIPGKTSEIVSMKEAKDLESVSKLEPKTNPSSILKKLPATALARKRRISSDPTDASSKNPKVEKQRKLSASEVSSTSNETSNLDIADPSDTYESIFTTKRTSPSQDSNLGDQIPDVVVSKKLNKSIDQNVPRKEFLEAKVVLKKLIIPIPECLLMTNFHKKYVKSKSQSLQKTLEKVSKVLQETLVDTPKEKRNAGRPLKLEDSIMEPLIRKQGVKRHQMNTSRPLQQKVQNIGKKSKPQRTVGRPKKQELSRKSAQHKIAKKSSLPKITSKKVLQQKSHLKSMHQKSVARSVQRLKAISKSPQQKKTSLKQKQQKVISKPVQKQIKISKPNSLKLMRMPSIALKLSSRKRTVATKLASSRLKKTLSAVHSRKITRSITAKPLTRSKELKPHTRAKSVNSQKVSANIKRVKNVKKSVVKKQEKKVISSNIQRDDKKKISNKSTEVTKSPSKVSTKSKAIVRRKLAPSVSSVAKNVNKKASAMLKPPKKILTTDKMQKVLPVRSSPPRESNSESGENMAEDEWIVEVLLDENEMDMSEGCTHKEIGNIDKVSSSDDRPRGSHANNSEKIECDSSTDTNKSRRNIASSRHAKKINDRRTSNKHTEQSVRPNNLKQVSSSVIDGKVVPEEHTALSAEQKMAEMRKAIGDLERMADRSMLRLKTEERQVVYLHHKLRQYESDKHYKMLRKIMSDGAPGPKQNTDAAFILDLILSYCPEDDDPASS